MKIVVSKNSVNYSNSNINETINLGVIDIQKYSFQVVDHIVEQIVPSIENYYEEIEVIGGTLEAKMIARKIEDKIKREVNFR